ncbi:glycosyl transferase [Pectobacterium brasiliense]|uniref:glycosyltransferase n=1 Tax=Pectobacterium brasiliense TaxID=180957 RepID=UPI000CE68F9E|nr:glycosyltransferase [Pectobacterium brasiliense]PPE61362.1 glycosyl transferase [Pectobacterium brasiliense]
MYDIIFVTHLPAFYKINLYNEIAKNKKILVLFISSGSEIRNDDFIKGTMNFEYKFINQGGFELRRKYSSLLQLLKLLRSVQYQKIVIGGWDLIEFWGIAFTSPRKKNAVVIESTRYESLVSGLKGKIKKLFLSRISTAFCSGAPHRELIESLSFPGEIITTYGVGLNNHAMDSHAKHDKHTYRGRFLYVGRLSEEKGLDFLLDFFCQQPELSLTIVGDGPQRESLERKAGENIQFKGYVNNSELNSIFVEHDVFIFPSTSEPWGLVVEEALVYGLPVICSDKVGCGQDLVEAYKAGIIFSANNTASLSNAISEMGERYDEFCSNTSMISFSEINKKQIESYY